MQIPREFRINQQPQPHRTTNMNKQQKKSDGTDLRAVQIADIFTTAGLVRLKPEVGRISEGLVLLARPFEILREEFSQRRQSANGKLTANRLLSLLRHRKLISIMQAESPDAVMEALSYCSGAEDPDLYITAAVDRLNWLLDDAEKAEEFYAKDQDVGRETTEINEVIQRLDATCDKVDNVLSRKRKLAIDECAADGNAGGASDGGGIMPEDNLPTIPEGEPGIRCKHNPNVRHESETRVDSPSNGPTTFTTLRQHGLRVFKQGQ